MQNVNTKTLSRYTTDFFFRLCECKASLLEALVLCPPQTAVLQRLVWISEVAARLQSAMHAGQHVQTAVFPQHKPDLCSVFVAAM